MHENNFATLSFVGKTDNNVRKSSLAQTASGSIFIVDGLPEERDDDGQPREGDHELMPGAFIGYKKRKSLAIAAKPNSLGGKVKLTLPAGLSLYDAQENGNPISSPYEWNANSIPTGMYVQGDGASTDMRDKNCHVDWTDVQELSVRDTANVTVVKVALRPYTPTTKYIGPLLIPEPKYSANGVGVRLNGDYDNGGSARDWAINATIPAENDLIRTDIQAIPPLPSATGNGLKYVLKKASDRVSFWETSKKGGVPYVVPTTGKNIVSGGTLWAEWCQNMHGSCNFSLEAIEESWHNR